MPLVWTLIVIAAAAALGMALGRWQALRAAGGDSRRLHSLPSYHAVFVAFAAAIPALIVLAVWLVLQPVIVERSAGSRLAEASYANDGEYSLLKADMRRIAQGIDIAVARGLLSPAEARSPDTDASKLFDALSAAGASAGEGVDPSLLAAAQRYRTLDDRGGTAMLVILGLLVVGGLGLGTSRIEPEFRARNAVERGVIALLILASTIAILTTLGIVLSMLFESIDFFSRYPAGEFFLGLDWAPNFRGNSELGILPLLWGTLYISLIALLVAVPIGLLAAIYMSEYADRRFRSVAKPLLEILAGIPTIVYGLFALITVGPFLRDYFAQPMGLGNSSSSVMTAGLVMGIMLIPFVSSLSDDVINAVPQAMRDGSLGLGATRSETIRQVVIPAALPGIVGSILLAASRAIGETMIVVLGAGAAARLDLNPFEAMTTVTVKIVSQLTGDTDFNSPETLVAFALGLTLFVITLGLNVFALWIVRRYREQYE